MTGSEIAWLIIAGAVVVLVIFLVFLLQKIGKTVDSVNRSVTIVTEDADCLLHQVDALLTKTNSLVEDINGKVETIDPLFVAVAELSESISDLNAQSRNLVTHVSTKAKAAGRIASISVAAGQLLTFLKKRKAED